MFQLQAGVGSIPVLVLGDLEDVFCMDILHDARRGLKNEVEDGDLWEELFKEPRRRGWLCAVASAHDI